MPPIQQTDAQRAAALNPTPTAIQSPGTGFFTDGYGSLFRNNNGNVTSFDLTSILSPDQLRSSGNYSGQLSLAKQLLQTNHGINFDALPKVNLGDFMRNGGYGVYGNNPINQGSFSDIPTLAPAASLSSTTINSTPNSLGTPLTPATPSGQNVQTKTDASGNITSESSVPLANSALPPINTALQVRPGETTAQYNARIAAAFPNLPAPGTTSSTGVVNNTPVSQAPISSANLSPQTPVTYTPTPALPSNTPDASAYATPPLTLTPQQQKESDANAALQGLNTQEAGKAAYQNTENSAFGVDTQQKAVDDLNAQLSTLVNEATIIKLTPQQGQGVTTAIDTRQRNEALRQNAVASLSVSSLLDAAKGLLTSAQNKADKAVGLIYDPIEAQIKAAQANLTLIANDPKTTVEEKNQAQAQLDVKNQQLAVLAQQKIDQADAWKVATDAAANINGFTPTSQYQTVAQALDAIQKAKDKVTALNIATATGLTNAQAKTGTWSTPYMLGGNLVQTNSATNETRTAVNLPNTPSSVGVGNDLGDARSAISSGADPEEVRQAFLKDHPSASSDWDSYFTPSNTSKVSYPTPAAPKSSFNIFDPKTWL